MPSTAPTQTASGADRPRLAAHVRLTFDRARERHVLLTPESVTVLNATAAAVLGLCDGERTVSD
ncbi:MAG: pyrroloquinoline quinone biosynthesis peptide chaperone PqqD, partial [Geodermatophilales bacterium]|nr:pyrroloquinoline quinone biosynthesis peptide chaperone PqqD [Geodermatophilales bacterium]